MYNIFISSFFHEIDKKRNLTFVTKYLELAKKLILKK